MFSDNVPVDIDLMFEQVKWFDPPVDIKNKVIDSLRKEGYDLVEENPGKRQGTDLRFSKLQQDVVIEAEGNKRPNGDPKKQSQMYTHFLRAVGQLCIRITKYGKKTRYALALPREQYYLTKAKETMAGLRRLKVGVYWVEDDGKVTFEQL